MGTYVVAGSLDSACGIRDVRRRHPFDRFLDRDFSSFAVEVRRLKSACKAAAASYPQRSKSGATDESVGLVFSQIVSLLSTSSICRCSGMRMPEGLQRLIVHFAL